MNTTFVDTSFLIALLRKKDHLHERALVWHQSVVGELLTTEYVLLELVDALSSPSVRVEAASAVDALRRSPSVRVCLGSSALLDEGLVFFRLHRDKRWSLTDCISFIVMRREGVTDALSNDRDFEQAGFRALLRSDPP